MFLRTIRLAVFTAVSLLFASLAFAISYCAKPNGIATRDLAFQLTGELRADLAARFGSKGKYLILAQVPDSLQSRTDFLAIERKETVRQVSKDPSKRELFSKFAKENGTDISPEQVTPEIIQSLLGPATASSDPIGLLYLYSNDLQTLRRFSSDIADTKGLVIEGEPADIEGLLTSGPENKKFFGWWEKNIPRDLDYLVLAGFSPSPAPLRPCPAPRVSP